MVLFRGLNNKEMDEKRCWLDTAWLHGPLIWFPNSEPQTGNILVLIQLSSNDYLSKGFDLTHQLDVFCTYLWPLTESECTRSGVSHPSRSLSIQELLFSWKNLLIFANKQKWSESFASKVVAAFSGAAGPFLRPQIIDPFISRCTTRLFLPKIILHHNTLWGFCTWGSVTIWLSTYGVSGKSSLNLPVTLTIPLSPARKWTSRTIIMYLKMLPRVLYISRSLRDRCDCN